MKKKNTIKEIIYNTFVISGFILLGIMASPPHPSTKAVWLLVAFGIWQVISARMFRSSIRDTQERFLGLCNDFRDSSASWRIQCSHLEKYIRRLKKTLINNRINPDIDEPF